MGTDNCLRSTKTRIALRRFAKVFEQRLHRQLTFVGCAWMLLVARRALMFFFLLKWVGWRRGLYGPQLRPSCLTLSAPRGVARGGRLCVGFVLNLMFETNWGVSIGSAI